MSSMVTICLKHIICPTWDIDLYLEGKYLFEENSTRAHLISTKCPIIENNKLPLHKRDKEFSLYPFCKQYPCRYLSEFKESIDITIDGYSQ